MGGAAAFGGAAGAAGQGGGGSGGAAGAGGTDGGAADVRDGSSEEAFPATGAVSASGVAVGPSGMTQVGGGGAP